MNIDLISQNYIENYTEFKTVRVKRAWDLLIMVVEGEYLISARESQKSFIIKNNEIMFVPAGVEFERKAISPLFCYHIAFYPQAEHSFYTSAQLGKINLPLEQRVAIFKTMERAFILPDNRELIANLISHVFAENYLFCKNEKEPKRYLSDEIQEAMRYMRNNFAKKIDMDELAAMVFLSHSGLIWKFKRELNTTPAKYLNIIRLRYAKQLLLNYSYSITEISEMCGFSNPYYFTNSFRRMFGMSPSALRNYYLRRE